MLNNNPNGVLNSEGDSNLTLTAEEQARCPSEFAGNTFSDKFRCLFSSLLYPFSGLVYFFKEKLMVMFILDFFAITFLVIIASIVSMGGAFGLIFLIWRLTWTKYLSVPELVPPAVSYLVGIIVIGGFTIIVGIFVFILVMELGVRFILNPNLERMAKVVEDIMYGKKNAKLRNCCPGCCDSDCWTDWFWRILTNILSLLMIFVMHGFIIPIGISILDAIPAVGGFLSIIFLFLALGFEVGVLTMGTVLFMKLKNSLKMWEWIFQKNHFFCVTGFGLGQILFLYVPFVNVVFAMFMTFANVVGSMRLWVHLENAEKGKINFPNKNAEMNNQTVQRVVYRQVPQQQVMYVPVQQPVQQVMYVQAPVGGPMVVQPQQIVTNQVQVQRQPVVQSAQTTVVLPEQPKMESDVKSRGSDLYPEVMDRISEKMEDPTYVGIEMNPDDQDQAY